MSGLGRDGGLKVAVLAGGVGGSRFLLGVRSWLRANEPDHELTAIVNTGDDMWHVGLRITPDLDTIMYALAGVNDTDRGWGRVGETERVSTELREWGIGWPWFTLGDLDLGAHITRSALLRDGVPLSQVVERLTARWPLGSRLIPATDQEAETHVVVDDPDAPGVSRELHFQEWWTRFRASLPARAFVSRGIEAARPAAGVAEALAEADVILLAPSNPVVSIGTILEVPGMRELLLAATATIVGVSPIIGGAVVRGMADACLDALGIETSAAAVGRLLSTGDNAGLLDGWLVATEDVDAVAGLEAGGLRTRAVPLWMRDETLSAALAGDAIAFAQELGSDR
ncbi:2-phospho-L-lactate transferase [soil metagenome]